MGYLKDMYGQRSQDFIDGVKAGIIMYAIWNDGKQVVGSQQTPLKEALDEIDREFFAETSDVTR